MATRKQIAAARKNLKKARAASRARSTGRTARKGSRRRRSSGPDGAFIDTGNGGVFDMGSP